MTRTRLVAVPIVLAVLGGCGLSNRLGTPGGGGPAYHVDAIFEDVLDLVPRAAVKVSDVTVGSVESVHLDKDMRARVTLRILKGTELPANAIAILRQTSLLGEKFIELSTPETGGSGQLKDGDVIPAERSERNPEVEEVFTALSALLNGGGLPELQTIAVELTRALSGRETQVQSVFRRLDRFVTVLDSRRKDIGRAIDALDSFAGKLAKQEAVVAAVLDDFTPALKALADQREELVALFTKLNRLAEVGANVVQQSHGDTLADLRMLNPILAQVAGVRDTVAQVVDQLVAFTTLVPRAIPGDYLQLFVTLYVSPETLPVDLSAGLRGASRAPTGRPAPRSLAELLAGVVS